MADRRVTVVVRVILLTAATLAATAARLHAQEPVTTEQRRVVVGSEIVATSKYIWRGFDEGPGMRVQPNIWLTWGGLQFSSWFDLSPGAESGSRFTENDLTLEYGRSFGPYEIRGGWTGYFLPNDEEGHSHELFIAVQRDSLLSPSLAIYQDFRRGDGTYVMAAIEHAWPVSLRGGELSASLSTGYNHHHWTTETGWSDANLGLRATWPLAGARLALSPFVNYSRSLNRNIVPSRFYGGVELAIR